MNPAQILSVFSALAATVWSVWTWSEEQEKQRQLKRDQAAALYVNSFMLAIAELQSRLHSILEEDDLAFYKTEYPERYEFGSPAAIEILYHLSQYFGWGYCTYRFGPYTKDSRVIELVRKIGETFETRGKFSGDAFRFSLDERVSLGQAVVRRIGEVTAILPVFQSIPLFQFQEELIDDQCKHAQLYQSRAVRCTLSAIDRADRAEVLEGYERLAVLQNLLTDLLVYLESEEGFRISIEEPKRARLMGVNVSLSALQPTFASILHQTRGRIRLRVPRLQTDEAYANALQLVLGSLDDVTSVRINAAAASVILYHTPDIPEAEFAGKALKAIQEGFEMAPVH
ncbi:MAG: hypothetical protein WAW37_08690 [Syntrophobacteraceae bacterium]